MSNNGITDEPSFYDLDRYRLDEEWNNQPRLFYKHAMQLSEARAEHERCKAAQDLVRAELDREVRLEPARFEIAKITETAVENAVILNKRYRKALARTLQARKDVNDLEVAVQTLEHRKRALEKLVELFAMSYYAEPRASKRIDPEAINDAAKKNLRKRGQQRV